jgi:hypothetical protein
VAKPEVGGGDFRPARQGIRGTPVEVARDREEIACSGRPEELLRGSHHVCIYRIPADGGPLQPVTNLPESSLFIEEPTISPDGEFLVYARSRGGSSLWFLTLSTMRAPSSQ